MRNSILFLKKLLCHTVTKKTKGSFLFKLFFVSFLTVLIGNTNAQEAVTVLSQSFDHTSSTQPWGDGLSRGWFKNAQIVSVPGKGQALQFNFQQGSLGSADGCGNYKIFLDSLYKELYFSWEYYLPSDFDYGYSDQYGGGKFFGGFSGGPVTKIPHVNVDGHEGWLSMLIFQNGNYRTYNYFKNTSYSKDGWPNGQLVANLVKGQWRRITIRAKMNDGDQANGLFEVYDNDILKVQLTGLKFVNGLHPDYLIDAVDLNLFFGGGQAAYKSPKSQYVRIDNMIVFYYPKSSSGYRSGASESGRKLSIPAVTDKTPVAPNRFKSPNMTDKSGYIDSHCGFFIPVGYSGFKTATINATGASSLTINVTKFAPDKGQTSTGMMQILKIYSGTGSNKKLLRTFDRNNPSLASYTISGNSATIEWQAGFGYNNGFSLTYNSNGTQTGKDIYCNHKHTALQNSPAPVQPKPVVLSTPANLSLVSVNTTSSVLKWTIASGSQTGLELQRLSSTGTLMKSIALGNTVTQYTDNGLIPNTAYQYRIRSTDGTSYSSFSATINVKTSALSSSPAPATSMLADWPFEEGNGTITKDLSGSNHNGSLVSGTSYSTDRKAGNYSLKFDGADDYLNAGAINLGNEFTISMWAKMNTSDARIRTLLANSNSGATQNGLRIAINTYGTSDRRINVMTGNGSAYNDAYSTTGIFELNRWNHIAVTINRTSGKARIYYNGTDVTSDSLILNNFNNTNTINIGRMLNASFNFAGNIDDVKIFSRVLSKSEIQALISGVSSPALNPDEAADTTGQDADQDTTNISGIVDKAENVNILSVFPNPSSGLIHVTLDDEDITGSVRISVADITGKIIYKELETEMGSTQKTIDLSSKTSGVYFLMVETAKGKFTRKFIIQ